MRKGILILLCILSFSANSYAEEKMICYVPKKDVPKKDIPKKDVPKKDVPKPVEPIQPVKKEGVDKSIYTDSSSVSSDLTSQNTQVVVSYPQSNCDKKNESNTKENVYLSAAKGFASFFLRFLSITTWPFLIFILLHKFEKEIRQLIRRIKKGNVAGIDFEFHDIADKYDNVNGDVTPEQKVNTYLDPRGTIISEWISIEAKIIQLFDKKGGIFRFPSRKNSKRISSILINELKNHKLVSHDVLEKINDLRMMRNEVAHESDLNLSEEDVTKFLLVANDVKAKLDYKINHLF